jgi:glycosyltransferase involved in cell wall biosynthesis
VNPTPVLSVIIPVWNGERYLAEAITSVLNQVGAPALEVIVVDDGSEDGSTDVAARFPVRCLRMAHRGLPAARNAGGEIAKGEYLLHFDSDDVLPPTSIASRMSQFHGTSAADIVVGQMVSFISPELDGETASRFRVPSEPQRGGLGASVVRSCFASRVGLFDTARTNSADLDWMVRAMEQRPQVVELPTVVLHRRIHGRNLSLARSQFAGDRLAIIRDAMHRRREAEGG